jgi:hypothetical protein
MILAAIQAGTAEFSCEACQADPSVPAAMGCETPAQVVVWETEDDAFYSCPVSFISDAIWSWYSEQIYYKEFGGAPPHDKQSALWLDAWSIYSSYYGKFLKESHSKEDVTGKSLDSLRDAHNRGDDNG